MIPLLLWTSQATVLLILLHFPHSRRDPCFSRSPSSLSSPSAVPLPPHFFLFLFHPLSCFSLSPQKDNCHRKIFFFSKAASAPEAPRNRTLFRFNRKQRRSSAERRHQSRRHTATHTQPATHTQQHTAGNTQPATLGPSSSLSSDASSSNVTPR